MAGRSRKGKGKGRKDPTVITSVSQAMHPSSSSKIQYRGPIRALSAAEEQSVVVTNLLYTTTLTSTAGGVIANVFDTSMTALGDWANLANSFDEFRVLAFELEYYPDNRYSKTTTVCRSGVGVVDHDDNTPLASISLGFQYESARPLSLEDPWSDSRDYRGSSVPALKWHMSGSEEAVWLSTQVPDPTTGSIKLYFDGLTVSTTYGRVLQRMLVQFRGRD